MGSSVVEYVGIAHALKERVVERWTQFWNLDTETGSVGVGEQNDSESNFRNKVKERLERLKKQSIRRIDRSSSVDEDFSHLTRPKTRKELVQISAAVMGIEFSYAAETAFVSPLLLNIGLRHRHMTLMWCLSPLVGFFVTPLLGSLSDGCKSQLGRRRPFILLLSLGIILGLILVPNGKSIGRALGDTYKDDARSANSNLSNEKVPHALARLSPTTTTTPSDPFPSSSHLLGLVFGKSNLTQSDEGIKVTTKSLAYKQNYFSKYSPTMDEEGFRERNNLNSKENDEKEFLKTLKGKKFPSFSMDAGNEEGINEISRNKKASLPQDAEKDKSQNEDESSVKNHPWGLVFTVLGTVLLDFDADACQSPSRAYMLDVTIPEDHARGLSTFTVMAGLGGCLGYFLGALNWENTFIGHFFGGQVRAVFTLVLFIFVACVIVTIKSFREIPLNLLWASQPKGPVAGFVAESTKHNNSGPYARFDDDTDLEIGDVGKVGKSYGTVLHETSFTGNGESNTLPLPIESEKIPTFREYLKTIVQLPKSLQWLCLTNFFCWMSLVCYSLYFTDFVGEAVFEGDPTAPLGSASRTLYDDGVRFGCWGMSLYSLSCSLYSLCIESFVNRFGAKKVYITGQIVYSVGMVLMAIARHPFGVIVFSWTAGIMYATLFTMPYLLVARYHAAETFDVDIDDLVTKPSQMRGLGTDVAIVSSMVFLAQMTQAVTLGSVVAAVGSTTAIVCAASLFAACGAISATKVLYLDL